MTLHCAAHEAPELPAGDCSHHEALLPAVLVRVELHGVLLIGLQVFIVEKG